MNRWIVSVSLALAAALLGVLVVLLLMTGSNSVSAGPLARLAAPHIMWGKKHLTATLSFTTTSDLPACESAPPGADIVLALDCSGSMEGAPAQQARRAAQAFVDAIDLSHNRAAILYFDSDVHIAQSLTNEKHLLQTALQQEGGGGGTAIHLALQEAKIELTEAQGANSPVVIVLTDGGADDEQAAKTAARRLKDAGTRLAFVVLPGDDLNVPLIQNLASTPSDVFKPPSVDELATVYLELAEEIGQATATDVTLREDLNVGAFRVLTDSLRPAGTVVEGKPSWQLPYLTQRGITLTYQVVALKWGLHRLAGQATTLSLQDCMQNTQAWTLGVGPKILVLPPPWLIILPFLFLLLPPLLFIFGRRKPKDKTQTERPPKPAPASRPAPPPLTANPLPAWLQDLTEKDALPTTLLQGEEAELQDTLLIGLGPAGRVVLAQIASDLEQRFGASPPSNVRLLQIDVQLESDKGPALQKPPGLSSSQWVLLQPNLSEIERNLRDSRENWPHLHWYDCTAPSYGRARGRMALFYDLKDGRAGSGVWPALDRALAGLKSPVIRVVGTTFDDTSSGMLVDIVRLVQIIRGSNVDVGLWLCGPVGQDWSPELHNRQRQLRQSEQAVRTLATLRELERFQRNAKIPFVYVHAKSFQDQLRDVSDGAVVQTIFLFQPANPKVPPEDGVLASMADSLLALLETQAQQQLVRHLADNRKIAGDLINRSGKGVTCALGVFSMRLPGETLRRALVWRMVRDLLFDAVVGMMPRERTAADGRYLSGQEMLLETDPRQRRQAAADFVDRFSGKLNQPAFMFTVAKHIDRLLNGGVDASEPILERSGGLSKARLWAESLQTALRRERELESARRITALLEALTGWENWLRDGAYRACVQSWQAARQDLARLQQQSTRRWALDDSLEWNPYQDRIRPWLERPEGGSAGEPLLRAARRFGWHVQYDKNNGRWRLDLLIPPPDFIWREGERPQRFAVERGQSVLEKFYTLVEPFARTLPGRSGALTKAGQLAPQVWLEQSQTHLQKNDIEASRQMSRLREVGLLVANESRQAQDFRRELADLRTLPIELCTNANPDAVTLLRVTDWLPLSTTALYDEDAWRRSPLPTHYVWTTEQLLSTAEGEGETRISARFATLLAQDRELVDLFALAYLYQVTDYDPHTVSSDLARLFDPEEQPKAFKREHTRRKELDNLREMIESVRQTAPDEKRALLREARQTRVEPLLNSVDDDQRDFGLYLQYLLEHE